jgi:DNA invertase Pin-like site-specific DNA recombinase
MRRSSLGSSAIGAAEEGQVIPLPTALTRATSSGAVAVAQRRAVAYVRESTEEQGKGFSPEGQRQAIASYAREHSFELLDEYMDFESGRKVDKRDEFQRLIGDAGAHKFDAVLIFHTSRFARNTIEAKHYKKLLRSELGIEVISVTQPLGDANDPATFLAESVHEIFDEYYSVSLSFWTTMGLKEKARQGFLTGGLAWGYLKGEDGIAIPDPERAPLVLAIFEIYATGRYSHRDIALWLNERDQRTTRGNLFCADTVRDMLGNLTYCGYVTAQRSTSKEIRGKHQPLVSEELFDRCAELRRQRTTTKHPGPGSPLYLLRSIVRCERCNGRMHGCVGGRKRERRYYCVTRRKQHAATSRSPPRCRSRTSSQTSSPRSARARRSATRSCTASPRTSTPTPRRSAASAASSTSAASGFATSMSSATSTRPPTQPSARASTPSWTASPPAPPQTSTAPAPCSKTSGASGRKRPILSRAASWCSSSSSGSGSTARNSSPCAQRQHLQGFSPPRQRPRRLKRRRVR